MTVRLREGRELKGLMKRRREKDKTTGEREENEGLGWVLFLFAPSFFLATLDNQGFITTCSSLT